MLEFQRSSPVLSLSSPPPILLPSLFCSHAFIIVTFLLYYSFVPKSQPKMTRMPRPFPVLPINDDCESDSEADENNHLLANRSPDRGGSHNSKGSSQKSTILSPFALGLTSTPLGPKSATFIIEECQIRLAQIGSEIQKAQIMFDNTTNWEVGSACRRRISKLAEERRIHQIVQERYKIQIMLTTTRVESVRVACEERLLQLMSELKSLEVSGENGAGRRDASGGRSNRDSPGGAANDEDAGDEDGGCYDRVLEYLGGAEVTHDETLIKSPNGRVHCHLDRGRRPERAPRDDDRGRASRRRGRADTAITARDGTRREITSVSRECQARARSAVLSPRSDVTRLGKSSRGPQPGRPPRDNRHPVAYAVKSRTPWIG